MDTNSLEKGERRRRRWQRGGSSGGSSDDSSSSVDVGGDTTDEWNRKYVFLTLEKK